MINMTKERKEELGNKFLMTPIENNTEEMNLELLHLELQEIIYLISSARYYMENDAENSTEFGNKEKVFRIAAIEKIKNAECLYIAYSGVTGYPYIDDSGRTWIFSKKEIAEIAVEYYKEQKINIEIKEIQNQDIISNFALMYSWGMEDLLVDNGQFVLEIKRADILPPPDYSNMPQINVPVTNPALQKSMLHFFQTLYTKTEFEGKNMILAQLESDMLERVADTKYLVAVKLSEKEPTLPDENGNKVIKSGAEIQFANITDQNEGSIWLPAFTDWDEFSKTFDKEEWNGNICSYDDLITISQRCSGIVINPHGISFRIAEENKKQIDEFRLIRKNSVLS